MKDFTNETPDIETIRRYWGSLEAYQEEQRRHAIVILDSARPEKPANWFWDFSTTLNRKNHTHGSFKLFGRR